MRWFFCKILFRIIIFSTKLLKRIAPPEFRAWAEAGFPCQEEKTYAKYTKIP